ncbi:MAG: hypothetical protein M3360_08620 [Actinomycetota bacterium]|nr:hypothetical protein [Actinomycetota bacterium]
MPNDSALGSFHVHKGHAFEGFTIENRRGVVMLVARCDCGAALDVADAVFRDCPDCNEPGREATNCGRCGATGIVVDHTALIWRQP